PAALTPCDLRWNPYSSMRSTRPLPSAHRSRRRKAWVSAPWSAITSPFRYVFPVSQSLTTRRTRYRGFCFTAMNSAIFAAAHESLNVPWNTARRWCAITASLFATSFSALRLWLPARSMPGYVLRAASTLRRLLSKVADGQVLGPEHGACVRLLASDQDFEEGRLAGAVRTDEAELVPFREFEVDVREEEAAAVGLRDAFEAHNSGTRRTL